MTDVHPMSSSRMVSIVAAGIVGISVIAGASWFALRSEAAPAVQPDPLHGPSAGPSATIPLAQADPVPVSGTRQGETVRGALVLPDASTRLTPADLAGLSRAQLDTLRRDVVARRESATRTQMVGSGTSEIDAANIRAIDDAVKSR